MRLNRFHLSDQDRIATKLQMFAPVSGIAEAKKSPLKKACITVRGRVTSVSIYKLCPFI